MPRREDETRHGGGLNTVAFPATPATEPFPPAPKGLDATGRAAWRRGKKLWEIGTLTSVDLRAWETYCRAVQEVRHCESIVKKEGEYHVAKNKCVIQHPAIKRRESAQNVMWRYEQAFAIVPSARKGVKKKHKPGIAARGRTG